MRHEQMDIPVDAIRAAAQRADVIAAMRAFYAGFDARIAAEPATCWNRGACCHFGRYGHRLYVTTLEAAYYLAMADATPVTRLRDTGLRVADDQRRDAGATLLPIHTGDAPVPHPIPDRLEAGPTNPVVGDRSLELAGEIHDKTDTCPHAFDGRCHARQRRPLGCRIFFCDPAAQHWLGPMTETGLAELRALHERFDVPYVYADWMEMLRSLAD